VRCSFYPAVLARRPTTNPHGLCSQKNLSGAFRVICEIKYSYSRKRNVAKLNYFVPLSGTVQIDGIEYYVKVLTEAGYFDVALDLSNLDTSDKVGV